jgi:hypothetical protein
MEDRLDLYEASDDPKRPRVCVDARPCQLLGDGHAPLPMVAGHPARVDDEYIRHDPGHLCLMVEPFQGWRPLRVPPRRTKRECAYGMAALVDVHLPEAEKTRVVVDNLSTHTPAALYAVFPPTAARRLWRQLEWHLPPVHGRWLDMAKIALAVLARQWLNRRLADETTMAREVAAWEARRNHHRAPIDWRVTTADARMKLKSLYPKESA